MKQVIIRLLFVLLITVPLALAAFGFVPIHGSVSSLGNISTQVVTWLSIVPSLFLLFCITASNFSKHRIQALTAIRKTLTQFDEKNTFGGRLFAIAHVLSTIILLLACSYMTTAVVLAVVLFIDPLMHGYAQSVYSKATGKRTAALTNTQTYRQ